MPKTQPDEARRRFVFGSATLTALSAAGCCTVPKPAIPGTCSPLPTPFLAGPEVLAAWGRPERNFDAHAHFFNGYDVPVEGFLAKSVAHSLPSPVLQKLLALLAPVAAALAKDFALPPEVEMKMLCRSTAVRSLDAVGQSFELDASIANHRAELAKALHEQILKRSQTVPAIVNSAAARARGAASSTYFRSSRQVEVQAFGIDFLERALEDGSSVRNPGTNELLSLSAATVTPEALEYARIQGVIQFVGFMLSPRHYNLRTYISRQAQASPKLPLSGCFSAMVDFNYWLDCPSAASPMRDQVLVQEQLSLLSRGFMLPLVGYNPWVDIKEKGASLDTVKWAINEHGCVGVKIYPPMGFYPYGNEAMPFDDGRETRPNLHLLDEALGNLYAVCDSLGVPVMAHANESNGRNNAEDVLGGNKGWEAVDGLKNLKSLYVNAGHFGGDVQRKPDDWTEGFAALMKNEQHLKLYGDLGYWDKLVTFPEARARLARILPERINGTETVADRTMYGSDWLMLSKEPGWETYAAQVFQVIHDIDPTGVTSKKVFGDNVMNLYGLKPESPRKVLGRLVDIFTRNGQPEGPGWLPHLP